MNEILFLGILLILGLASTRIVKIFKLPNVTGYLVVGLIASIICIFVDNINQNSELEDKLTLINNFVSSVALGFIALSIGEEFKLSKIKKYGGKIISITIIQALLTTLLVDISLIIVCIFTKQNIGLALCLGAIATATAPAATIMVINQYKAKGPLVDILLPVVAFDDAIGLIVFAISVSISKLLNTPNATIDFVSLILIPLIEVIGSIVIGFVLGVIMDIIVNLFKSRNNHAINLIAFTLLGVGICQLLNQIQINNQNLEFSNLLCCMMIGAVYSNLSKREEKKQIVHRDFDLIDHWTPFLFMLFFVLSGCHLGISCKEILTNTNQNIFIIAIILLVIYLIFRSLGKYLGSFIGSKITKQDKSITKYLGITLLPQAGVAIGMANQISNIDAFKLNIGPLIVTVTLCATLVYELIGPLLTKWSLQKAGEIPDENNNYQYMLKEND